MGLCFQISTQKVDKTSGFEEKDIIILIWSSTVLTDGHLGKKETGCMVKLLALNDNLYNYNRRLPNCILKLRSKETIPSACN